MKKMFYVILALLVIGTTVFASDNQSAIWVRTLCREAVTDNIDAAYLNPAGTAFLFFRRPAYGGSVCQTALFDTGAGTAGL